MGVAGFRHHEPVCRTFGGVEGGLLVQTVQDIRQSQVRVLEEVRMLHVDLKGVHVVELLKIDH